MADLGRVCADHRQIIGKLHLHFDTAILSGPSERLHSIKNQGLCIGILTVHLEPARFDPADIQQVLKNLMKAVTVFPGC